MEDEIRAQINKIEKDILETEIEYDQREQQVEKKTIEKYEPKINELEVSISKGVIESYKKEDAKELKVLYKSRNKELNIALKLLIKEKKSNIKARLWEIKALKKQLSALIKLKLYEGR